MNANWVNLSLFLDRMASATSPDEVTFKTPKNVRVRKFSSNGGTPVTIPASPFMKKLGCGTGVSVYLMDRFVVLNYHLFSPLSVKNKTLYLKRAVNIH